MGMSDIVIITGLFAVGLLVLVADIFLPSHAILTVVGLGLLGFAVYKVFVLYGATAGVISITACLVLWPAMVYVGVKHWYRTPAGRLLAPPNPTLTAEHIGVETESLAGLIGATGFALTPLRPVGTCRFGDRRVACVAESGHIERDAVVVGLAARSGQLVVAKAT
ncbi:MAG: hypothetical protein AMXMBFR22_03630 [Phycisphaerae bacterium]